MYCCNVSCNSTLIGCSHMYRRAAGIRRPMEGPIGWVGVGGGGGSKPDWKWQKDVGITEATGWVAHEPPRVADRRRSWLTRIRPDSTVLSVSGSEVGSRCCWRLSVKSWSLVSALLHGDGVEDRSVLALMGGAMWEEDRWAQTEVVAWSSCRQ